MNADGIASSYRWIEYAAFGRTLERARLDFVSQAADARRVLILGEGDGRFLAGLLESNPRANVMVLEASARMIDLARQRVPLSERRRVQFHRIDAVMDPWPEGTFDFAVSHFFLDVLTCQEAEAVICRVGALLSPEATWLISEFQEPPSGIRRLHARLWLHVMYGFFSVTTGLRATRLPPYRESFERRGFVEVAHRERRLGLIRSQVWRRPVA
jgi:ubiquinone/menaquinone biosynthesis C-methylase UbiE